MKASKILQLVIIAGIGLRIVLWCFQSAPEGDDGTRYLNESLNLIDHGVFSTARPSVEMPAPSAHDMPLWPSIMAVVYWATNSVQATKYIAGLINIVLVLGSALLLVSMLRAKPFEFNDKKIALSAAVFLYMPDSVIYSLFHMPDQLAVFFVVLGLWGYFRMTFAGVKYLFVATGAFLSAIYAKPICIPLSLALLVASVQMMDGKWYKRILLTSLSLGLIYVGLGPWMMRNKHTFGTAGITSISGTNLYHCNWGRLVDLMPEFQRKEMKSDMARFEKEIADLNLMDQSQKMGAYAKRKLVENLLEYAIYTCKVHPRLYVGTGSIAMLRYLGLDRICDALDISWSSGMSRGYFVQYDKPFTRGERFAGACLQLVSWAILLCGYVLVFWGFVTGIRQLGKPAERCKTLAFICPALSIILVAVVIGPITATRYRFIMIPFFAILAGYAVCSQANDASPRSAPNPA